MPLFDLGIIEITSAASAALRTAKVDLIEFVLRHQVGDWGDVDEDWQQLNDLAVQYGGEQIDSKYKLDDGLELLISTATDRSHTRILLDRELQCVPINILEGYALWAETYDQERNPLIAAEEAYVKPLLASLPFASVLDVGAGTGRYALKLAQGGAKVTAIDQSSEMLAIAQRNALAKNLTIDFHLTSLDNPLPYRSNQFNFLVCALTLTHISNLSQVIQEFYRVMQPGGHLLITNFHPAAVASGWQAMIFRPGITYVVPNMLHTKEDYLITLTTTNFTILNIIDVTVRDIPYGYLSEAWVSKNKDKPFSLIVLAQKL